MCELKKTLDAKGHCILEMPTGTGKTVTLLSFITSYHLSRPDMAKLIYCTRTVGEMEKVLEELQVVISYRDKAYVEDNPAAVTGAPKLLALGLTTRRNLCLKPEVSSMDSREEADSACRSLTASWVRSSVMDIEDVGGTDSNPKLCEYYEGHKREGIDSIMPSGIYTLDDLMQFGREKKWCPYYTARHSLSFANVIVYNYQYLLDPKISGLISKSLASESIVVFDEAHNIDTVCIDALSVNIREATLRKGLGNIARLRQYVQTAKDTDANRLQTEYTRLLDGLSTTVLPQLSAGDSLAANPIIPRDILREHVPGSIRKAEHFIQYLRRLIQFIRDKKMRGRESKQEQPSRFLYEMLNEMHSDKRPLRFCSDRLKSLLITLEVADVAEFTPLQLIADFATLLGTYGHTQSFGIVFEPVDERLPNIPDPVLQLACLDASLAMKPVFDKFQSVVLTSGTISPLPLYAKILGFNPIVMRSLTMSLQRQAICPLVVSRGADQAAISSKYDCRSDTSVVRNYGNLVIDLAGVVPDGIVVFFTSYIYMEQMISMWVEMGIINRLFEKKLVFIETPDGVESALALDRYRRACDTGRGAVFLCVARGKVAEGIDFDRHYGRAVLVLGVPFQYTESRVLRARLEYMRSNLDIREGDYLSFDAMRQTAQCIGRVVRSKADYGLAVLADKRYIRADKKNKLPMWIQNLMHESHLDLDTQASVSIARDYLRSMAQPLTEEQKRGALLNEQDVAKMSEKRNENNPIQI